MAKPIVIDNWTEKCAKCGFYVKKAYGTGQMFYGASESYEQWGIDEFDYCPNCGEKVERND